jgi:beta-phosphoglucomutase-like phosphatase (HAD superfamily)
MKWTEPEAIIFDCDGVLVDSEVIHIASELELLAKLGLTYDRATYLTRFVGLSNADFQAKVQADFKALIGDGFPSDFGTRLHKIAWPRIETELKAIDGVSELVQNYGGKIAVGSSSPYEKLIKKLEITRLQTIFTPHIYSADHVKAGKPEPDLFLYAAAQLGVNPSKCIVVEDSIHGVVAARAAGMTPIGFIGGGHADPALEQRLMAHGAKVVVSHHSQIQALLS